MKNGFVVMAKGPKDKKHKAVSNIYQTRSAAETFMAYWRRHRPAQDCFVTERGGTK